MATDEASCIRTRQPQRANRLIPAGGSTVLADDRATEAPSYRRVLLDGTSIGLKMKGVGRYAYHLAVHLERELRPERLEVLVAVSTDDLPTFPGDFRAQLLRIPAASEFETNVITLPRLLRDWRPVAFIRPADKIGFAYGVPTLTVCHDLNPLIWAHQPPRPGTRRAVDCVWEWLRGRGLRASDRVICNSDFVRQRAIAAFRLRADCVDVAPCGVDERLVALAALVDKAALKSDLAGQVGCDGYVLTFATGDEREGYSALPSVWAAAKAEGYPGALVIAGLNAGAPYAQRLRKDFAAKGVAQSVVWVPFLDETQMARLAGLYAAADFYLELSRHEGFGMQLVEAMACGAVCLSSGRGALKEVGGGFPIELSADSAEVGSMIAREWRLGSHTANVAAQVAYARSFTWSIAGKKVAEFVRSSVGR